MAGEDKGRLMGEEREFRIYVSDCGDRPVVDRIIGEKAKAQRLAEVRNQYPTSVVSVHEVFESTIQVYRPANGTVFRPGDPAPEIEGD